MFYGANLIALRKKDGGIRPIAVGSTLRRLSGKTIVDCVKSPVATKLWPLQVGFGPGGSCEGAIHSARMFMESHPETCRMMLKLDFRNAFNCVRRDKMESVVESLPEYAKYFQQAYGAPSTLCYGEHTILSESGVQPGDPVGPLLAC